MSKKSSKIIESPIAIPPEAGLEVGHPRPISYQDGLQVDWEAQKRYEAAIVQQEIVAELEGNRLFLRKYRRILGLSVLWFWVLMVVMVVLVAAGIGAGIAGGIKGKHGKDKDKGSNSTQSSSGLTNTTWPCQTDPYSNNTIVQATPGKDIAPTNFRLFCNRTFDVDSSRSLQRYAVPDTVANMGGCMEACLDYNAGNWSEGSSGVSDDSCYAVTINKNTTSGQQWCKLFSGSGWGTDEVGADCAVNLTPDIAPAIITGDRSGTRTSTTPLTNPTTYPNYQPISLSSVLPVQIYVMGSSTLVVTISPISEATAVVRQTS
ncbi:hypothetical protein NHQ30_004289 [Ciborinia camelliae]|nr:hypothetical protein NHQ30_004289 [Ciborinia camelliae]